MKKYLVILTGQKWKSAKQDGELPFPIDRWFVTRSRAETETTLKFTESTKFIYISKPGHMAGWEGHWIKL
jgi:hypothetical protein